MLCKYCGNNLAVIDEGCNIFTIQICNNCVNFNSFNMCKLLNEYTARYSKRCSKFKKKEL